MKVLGRSVMSNVGTSEICVDRRGAAVVRWFAGNRELLYQHRNNAALSTRPIGPFNHEVQGAQDWEFLKPKCGEGFEVVGARLRSDPELFDNDGFTGSSDFLRMDFSAMNRWTEGGASLSLLFTVQNLKNDVEEYVFTSGFGIQILLPFAAGMVVGSGRTDKKQFAEPPMGAPVLFDLTAKAQLWGDPQGKIRTSSIPIVYPDHTLLLDFGPEVDKLALFSGPEEGPYLGLMLFSSTLHVKRGMVTGIRCGLSYMPYVEVK